MATDSPEQSESGFEADVQIAKGMRKIDKHGTATISDGRLVLRKSQGDVIVDAPMSEVRAETARFSAGAAAKISIGDDSYTVGPLRIRRYGGDTLGSSANRLGRDIAALKQGKELTSAFLAAVEAEGGQLVAGE